jgi:F-type H+-transporting ATPase subunit a
MGLLPLLATAAEHAAEGAQATHAAGGEAHGPAAILMHHMVDQPLNLGLDLGPLGVVSTKHALFFLLAALAVLLLIRLALRTYRNGLPKGLGALVEIFVLFIRDDIVEKNIGHDGHKYTPLLCSFFFFILVAALIGLLPFAVTSTGNIAVTGALAAVSFVAMQYAGISKYGVIGHLRGLVPPGIPVWLLPIMILVEAIGIFTKPFALMVRLFANMLAGHVVIATLLMLIPLMASIQTLLGVAMMPVSLGLGLFILLLELLVALIQAYIFTLLSAIFIGMYAHPAH